MPTLTVSISPEDADRMREAIAGGAYASSSEVVRDALRLWAASMDDGRRRPFSRARGDADVVNVADLYARHSGSRPRP